MPMPMRRPTSTLIMVADMVKVGRLRHLTPWAVLLGTRKLAVAVIRQGMLYPHPLSPSGSSPPLPIILATVPTVLRTKRA